MITKLVAKNSLMLLFIKQFIIRTCLKMIKSFIFSKTIFRYNIVCRIRNFDYHRNVDDATILIDFLLISSNVNFLSFFDLKLYCIYMKSHFVRFFDFMLLLKSIFDLFLWMFRCYDSWCFNDLNIKYEKFISRERFDRMRRFFQSFWRFWFVVIVMNSREFEIIDVCRWKREQNRMIEVTYVNLSLYWMTLFLLKLLKFEFIF